MSRVSVEEEENKLRIKRNMCVHGRFLVMLHQQNVLIIYVVLTLWHYSSKNFVGYTRKMYTRHRCQVFSLNTYISKEYIVSYTVLYCHATFTKHIIQLIAGREPAYNSSAPLLYYYVYSLNDITLCIIVTHNRLYTFYIIIHILSW